MGAGILAVFFALILSPLIIAFIWGVPPCKPERFESVPVPNSPWVVEQWMALCGFGISGPLEIRVANTVDGSEMTIATIDDDGDTKLSFDDSGDLVITLPNLVNIWDEKSQFGNVKVIYDYQPNDPGKSRMMRRFRTNPNDIEAKLWYCNTIVAGMSQSGKTYWSKEAHCPQ